MIYADNAATTPIDPHVLEICSQAMELCYGNPSSLHPIGRRAHQILEAARRTVISYFNADGYQAVFNSGGTEGDNTAIIGAMRMQAKNGKHHIVLGAMEHPAVYNMCVELANTLGYTISLVYPGPNGVIDPASVQRAMTRRTGLVSVSMVSNELGTIQPVAEITRVSHQGGALFHTDAVQAVAHLPINLSKIKADVFTFTGHKIYGPKGIGCMLYKSETFPNLLHGGHQEMGVRPGTESVAQAAGLVAALELLSGCWDGTLCTASSAATKPFLSGLEGWECEHTFNPSGCDIVSLRVDGVRGEDAVILLGEAGLCVSAGSACAAGSHETSRTLKAIGLTARQAEETIRISFGRQNTAEDGTEAARIIRSVLS